MTAIPDIIDWSRRHGVAERPWLILGKGPTFRKLRTADVSAYGLLALNHVVRERPVDIAHAIDLDVVHHCGEAILANAGVLWMPAYPHVDFRVSDRPLWSWVDDVPVLRTLASEGRLAWYNASTRPKGKLPSPRVDVRFFSAEAALHALALCGAKTVRSLGIDGGNRYSDEFRDLADQTLLANGHASFDRQFEGMASIIRKTGVFYAPLTVQAPVRVYVGTDDTQHMGLKLLEYSIRRHASLSVHVEAIDNAGIPVPKDAANRARTGFSFSRFRIPALCGHRGRALYLDADMQVFSDIRPLWTTPFEDAHVLYAESSDQGGRVPQFSVMLLDCARLGWDVEDIVRGLDEGRYTYAALMQHLCVVDDRHKRAALPPEWNSLERFEAGRTHLLHYTDMPTQPWVSKANRNGHLFYGACRDAIAEGAISADFVYDEVERGHVAPDFPRWVGLRAHRRESALRAGWKPPYQRLVAPARTPAPERA